MRVFELDLKTDKREGVETLSLANLRISLLRVQFQVSNLKPMPQK